MKSKNVILYGVIAMAAVVGIAFFSGKIPPSKSNVAGTIGGANRYQSQQISDQDVVTQDPQVQAFLQTDLFHKLQTNPELARDMADAKMASVVNDRNFSAVADDNFAIARRRLEFNNALATDAFMSIVRRRAVQELFQAADLAQVRNLDQWRVLVEQQKYAALRADEGYRRVADQLASVCVASEARAVFQDQRVLELSKNAAFTDLLMSRKLDAFMGKGYMSDLLLARKAADGLRNDFQLADQLMRVKLQP